MPNPSRDKGSRFERQIVDELRGAGLDAYRIPLSGASVGFKSDVEVRLPGRKLTIEAKSRASGFTFIYQHIEGSDLLAIKADRKEPLVVMRLNDLAAIMGAKEGVQVLPASTTTTQSQKSLPAQSHVQSDKPLLCRGETFEDVVQVASSVR